MHPISWGVHDPNYRMMVSVDSTDRELYKNTPFRWSILRVCRPGHPRYTPTYPYTGTPCQKIRQRMFSHSMFSQSLLNTLTATRAPEHESPSSDPFFPSAGLLNSVEVSLKSVCWPFTGLMHYNAVLTMYPNAIYWPISTQNLGTILSQLRCI